jgi:putative GTP pyrophosphokinase
MSSTKRIIEQYRTTHPIYDAFGKRLAQALEDLLDLNSIPFQVVEYRTKTIESFSNKILRKGKSYKNPLNDIHDLCGCRIITYYEDDCKKVEALIRNEFDIFDEEMRHTAEFLEDDRFGYLSRHYIVRLGDARRQLGEWKRFEDLKAEIQVRTVIQHAWSAVEHALQYKAETQNPSRLRRRLFRIAGLFELADEEFVAIRDEQDRIKREASEKLDMGNEDIPLEISTLREFVSRWSEDKNIATIAEDAGFIFDEHSELDDNYLSLLKLCRKLKISKISTLHNSLLRFDSRVFSHIFSGQDNEDNDWHISIEFAVFLIVLDVHREEVGVDYLVNLGWDESIADHTMRSISAFHRS